MHLAVPGLGYLLLAPIVQLSVRWLPRVPVARPRLAETVQRPRAHLAVELRYHFGTLGTSYFSAVTLDESPLDKRAPNPTYRDPDQQSKDERK